MLYVPLIPKYGYLVKYKTGLPGTNLCTRDNKNNYNFNIKSITMWDSSIHLLKSILLTSVSVLFLFVCIIFCAPVFIFKNVHKISKK